MPLLRRRSVVSLLRKLAVGWLALGGFSLAPEAHASAPCATDLSPCFDANNLDLALGPSRFASLEDADVVLAPGRLSAAFSLSYLREPVVLTAASPDPMGRRVPLVSDVWQGDLLLAVGVTETLQLGFGLPVRLYQDGGGIQAVTARLGEELPHTASGDPRLGIGWQLFRGVVAARARLEVKLPLGDREAFAGAPGPTWTPALALSANRWDRWHFSAELGARLRPTTRLGDVRIGNQLRVALGARYSFTDTLSVGLEAWALPSLLEQPDTAYGRPRHVPAEWLASFGAELHPKLWMLAGAGTGLPLSSRGATLDGEREAGLGVTTPSWRALVQLRFTE